MSVVGVMTQGDAEALRLAWESALAEANKLDDELNDALDRGEIVDAIADRLHVARQAEEAARAAWLAVDSPT